MKIRVLWPGRIRNPHYRAAAEDYSGRIARLVPFELIQTREESLRDSARVQRIRKESAALQDKRNAPVTVVLDSHGKLLTSEQFAEWIEKQGTGIDFLLGGPEGLEIANPTLKLSFGLMTLPHELARVVLLEQIYRAMTILKRIPYHK